MRWIIMLFLVILMLISSCIESFIPETTGYEDVLCVEAQLTNDPTITPYVYISKTIPVLSAESGGKNRNQAMISGAIINVRCDDGTVRNFIESENGKYLPEDPLFIGETGKSYMISITVDGHVFESEYQILNEAPGIDGFNSKAIQKKVSDDGDLVYGLRFFISNHNDLSEHSYYRWILDATYKYNVPYNSEFIYQDGLFIRYENNEIMECYKNKTINGIYVSTTKGLEENRIIDAPINFESQYGDELSLMYCLHAKQLLISESAYNYWSDIDELINETGGLYEIQPFQLSGNIKCVSDPGKKIIGLFELAGVSEARAFFIRPNEFDILRWTCELLEVGTDLLPWDALWDGAFLFESSPGVFVTASNFCFDCRERGGVLEKPPFWE